MSMFQKLNQILLLTSIFSINLLTSCGGSPTPSSSPGANTEYLNNADLQKLQKFINDHESELSYLRLFNESIFQTIIDETGEFKENIKKTDKDAFEAKLKEIASKDVSEKLEVIKQTIQLEETKGDTKDNNKLTSLNELKEEFEKPRCIFCKKEGIDANSKSCDDCKKEKTKSIESKIDKAASKIKDKDKFYAELKTTYNLLDSTINKEDLAAKLLEEIKSKSELQELLNKIGTIADKIIIDEKKQEVTAIINQFILKLPKNTEAKFIAKLSTDETINTLDKLINKLAESKETLANIKIRCDNAFKEIEQENTKPSFTDDEKDQIRSLIDKVKESKFLSNEIKDNATKLLPAFIEEILKEPSKINKKKVDLGYKSGAGLFSLARLSAEIGDTNILKVLLKHKAEINFDLFKAGIDKEHFNIIKFLLDEKADVNVQDDKSGNTPLLHALYVGPETDVQKKIVKLLLSVEGIDVNKVNKGGDSALLVAPDYYDNEIFDLLLKKGADVNVQDAVGDTPLHIILVVDENQSCVEKMLTKDNININKLNNNNQTPLDKIKADQKDENEGSFYKFLRDNGFKHSNELESNENSSFTKAEKDTINSLIDTIKNLNDAIDEKNSDSDKKEKTRLDNLIKVLPNFINDILKNPKTTINKKIDSENISLIFVSASVNRNDIVRILLNHGAEVNDYLLFQALKQKNEEIVKLLLQNTTGEDLKDANGKDLKDAKGNTLLHLAVINKSLNIVKTLIEKGVDVNAINSSNETPLELAIKNDSIEIVNELLKSKKINNVNFAKKGEKSPLHYILEKNRKEIFETLLQYEQFDPNIKFNVYESPLFYIVSKYNEKNIKIVPKKKFKCMFELLVNTKNINLNIKNASNRTILMELILQETTHDLIPVLIKNASKVNFFLKDDNGDTILHYFMTHYKPDFETSVRDILSDSNIKINVNIENDNAQTPLDLLDGKSIDKNGDFYKHLKKQGFKDFSDKKVISKVTEKELDDMRKFENDIIRCSKIPKNIRAMVYSRFINVPAVIGQIFYRQDPPYDDIDKYIISFSHYKYSLADLAVICENEKILRILLNHGAELKLDLLIRAIVGRNINILKCLLEYDPNLELDVKSDTPLLIASRLKEINEEIIKLLIDRGAKVNVKNKDGKTPLDYLNEREGLTEGFYQYLLQMGCKLSSELNR